MADIGREVYEYEAVVNVPLPESGGTFPADVSGTVRAATWDEAEERLLELIEVNGSRCRKVKWTRHLATGGTITRYTTWGDEPDAGTTATAEAEAGASEVKVADQFWFGGITGVSFAREDTTWKKVDEFVRTKENDDG